MLTAFIVVYPVLILLYSISVYLPIATAGQKILKMSGQKTREIKNKLFFFWIFSIITKILLSENWKISKKKFREIDSSHFTSFLARTFLNFQGPTVKTEQIVHNIRLFYTQVPVIIKDILFIYNHKKFVIHAAAVCLLHFRTIFHHHSIFFVKLISRKKKSTSYSSYRL